MLIHWSATRQEVAAVVLPQVTRQEVAVVELRPVTRQEVAVVALPMMAQSNHSSQRNANRIRHAHLSKVAF